MIYSDIAPGYRAMDNCYKYTDDDSTITCYRYTREALKNKIKTTDKELNTNGVYMLIGEEDDKVKVYVGQGTTVISRVRKHLSSQAMTDECYYPYWNFALVFVCNNTEPSKQWTTATIDDLESILIDDTRPKYSWNQKDENIKNPIYPEMIRSNARKISDIKNYVHNLQFTFMDKVDEKDTDETDTIAVETKKFIDATVNLYTINLEPNALIPEYTTPEAVVNKMLDMLPWETFDHTTTFFDPACKGGEFLALIHDRLLKKLENDEYFSKYSEAERFIRIHDHIINNQLYGMAIGENSYRVAKERVYDCKNIMFAGNNYIEILKQFRSLNKEKVSETTKFEHELIRRQFGKDMKIDVVVGNPPYQGADNKSSIYPEFVEYAVDLSDITCMITRDNWLTGMAFEDLRNHLTDKGNVTKIYHYPVVGEIFNNVGVAVAYFIWNRQAEGKTLYTRIENNEIVLSQNGNIKNITLSETACNIIDKIPVTVDWGSYFSSRSYAFMDQRKRKALKSSNIQDENYNVAVLVNKDKAIYTAISNFQNVDEVKKYKVLCGVVINEALLGSPGNVLTNIKAIAPMQVASETWSLIATFNTEEETVNCKKYVQSRFFRFLANQTVNNRATVTKNAFKYIPIQDFTSQSDIDWSQSISDIDQRLYKKYNLTDAEISYIESTIKPMDSKPTKIQITKEDLLANYMHSQLEGGNRDGEE